MYYSYNIISVVCQHCIDCIYCLKWSYEVAQFLFLIPLGICVCTHQLTQVWADEGYS